MNKRKNLGDIGENICLKYLSLEGLEPILSENRFDIEKDIILKDGRLVEVKTQPAYWSTNIVSIKENQLKKCLECDILLFVLTPLEDRPHYSYQNCILRFDNPKNIKYEKYRKEFGSMIGFPIKQPGLDLVYQIIDKNDINLLRGNRSFYIDRLY